MYGMELMKNAVSPLAELPQFSEMMVKFNNPVLGVLIGALFTWADSEFGGFGGHPAGAVDDRFPYVRHGGSHCNGAEYRHLCDLHDLQYRHQ